MTDAAMKPIGEINGHKVYWADPSARFTTPGVYYWDGSTNVHVPIPAVVPTLPVDVAALVEEAQAFLDHRRPSADRPLADDIVPRLAAALEAAARRPGEWQDIASAPRDGTIIILGFFRPNFFTGPNGEPQAWMTLGLYDADHAPSLTPSAWQTTYGQGFDFTPTHWQPLPAPPATRGEG